jgi:hypothetical protein
LFEVWLHDEVDWLGPLKLKLSGLSSSREIICAAGLSSALIRCSGDNIFLHSARFDRLTSYKCDYPDIIQSFQLNRVLMVLITLLYVEARVSLLQARSEHGGEG